MSNNDEVLKKYMRLKKDVETAQQRANRAQGALDQLMKDLEKDFDCSTLKQAQKKLEALETEEEEAREEFEEAVEQFDEKWNSKLQGSDL